MPYYEVMSKDSSGNYVNLLGRKLLLRTPTDAIVFYRAELYRLGFSVEYINSLKYSCDESCKLTKEEAITLYRKLWRAIYDIVSTGVGIEFVDEVKNDMLERDGFNLINDCPLCEYACAKNNYDYITMCKYCPVDWGNGENEFQCENHNGVNGLYGAFKEADSWQEQAAFAKQISELPEREV